MGLRPHPGPSRTPSCPRLSLSYLTHLAVRGFAAEGRGPAGGKEGSPDRVAAAPWGPPGSCGSREGRGGSRAVNVQPAPLASCRQNVERGSAARETRGWRLRACGTQRNADAAGFSCREEGVSSPPGRSELDLRRPKRVAALPDVVLGGASGAAAAAPDRKIPPVATPASVGHPVKASERPSPLSLDLCRNPKN